jgi:UvrD-like helicase C-terminal domain/Nuclease-related domain/AAA domain
MAVMIPDSCPSRATAGEKRLFSLLQRLLPDNFTVLYEPDVHERHPDFTLLADTFGLLVIETKAWYPKHLSKVDPWTVELLIAEEGRTYVRKVANPLRQARDYMHGCMDTLQKEPLLCSPDGEHQGRLCFPCGYAVAFTNITREHLREAGLAAAFPPDRVLCRDELEELVAADSERATLQRLKRFFAPAFPFDPLTDDQVKTVRGLLHPEVVVKSREPSQESLLPPRQPPREARVLEVMDYKQERIARALGPGHRIFFGVAGSGKTVLLLARARILANRDPGRRILVLCYNRALATYLNGQLAGQTEFRNIQVRTFHSWAARTTGVYSEPDEDFAAYEKRLLAALLDTTQRWRDDQKYDAVLLDEGHDFCPDWFRCCTNALYGGLVGDLLIAVDGAQSVYGRSRTFRWKDVGINAQGRVRELSTNYRNTREILEFAWGVAQAGLPDDKETETHVRVHPTRAVRSGPRPEYRPCKDVTEECALVARLVRRYRDEGFAEKDIAVLYHREGGNRVAKLYQALKQVGEVCWITDKQGAGGRDSFLARPGVRLCTVKSSKGLEFPAVVFAAVDQLPHPYADDEVTDANLLYVGMTRAMERLVLTWCGKSKFTDRIVEHPGAAQSEVDVP